MPKKFSGIWASLLDDLDGLIDLIAQSGARARHARNSAVHEISDLYDIITQYREFERLEAPGETHDDFLGYWEKLGDMITRILEDPEGYDTTAHMEQRALEKIVDGIEGVRW